MARVKATANLDRYRPLLDQWMPGGDVRPAGDRLPRFDGCLTARVRGTAVRYLVEEKRHLRHLDAAVVAEQVNRRRAALPRAYAGYRVLLLAPHVRDQQAAVLQKAGIDYVDLAGNAHLNAPGLFVQVQGRRPPKEEPKMPLRPQKGWVKTVMVLLLRDDLADARYRAVAHDADVALGTVAACFRDLTLRGLLRGRQRVWTLPDRPALVALWVQAYLEALRPTLAERRFQVRVEDKQQLWERLTRVMVDRGQPWALTGADAAGRRDHYFRAEETEIYAPVGVLDDRELQKALQAQPTARGGNLLAIEPPGPLAMPLRGHDIPQAPDLLAYAELRYRGTDQAMEAATRLLPAVLGHATT